MEEKEIEVGMVLRHKTTGTKYKVYATLGEIVFIADDNIPTLNVGAMYGYHKDYIKSIYNIPVKTWEPKRGERYYFISSDGSISSTTYWPEAANDLNRKKIGNCFKSNELAEKGAEKIKKALRGE